MTVDYQDYYAYRVPEYYYEDPTVRSDSSQIKASSDGMGNTLSKCLLVKRAEVCGRAASDNASSYNIRRRAAAPTSV